jgi:hypothetical protein
MVLRRKNYAIEWIAVTDWSLIDDIDSRNHTLRQGVSGLAQIENRAP